MSDSVQPHRWPPTRLPRPWDSPGKNTGVGCHFLLQCMKVRSEKEVAQSCPTLNDLMDWSLPGSSVHGIFQARVLEWGGIAFSRLFGQKPTIHSPHVKLHERDILQTQKHAWPKQKNIAKTVVTTTKQQFRLSTSATCLSFPPVMVCSGVPMKWEMWKILVQSVLISTVSLEHFATLSDVPVIKYLNFYI